MEKHLKNFEEFVNETNMPPVIVSSAEEFEKLVNDRKWMNDKNIRKGLKNFIKDMDKKYGKDNHMYGRDSQFAHKHYVLYKEIGK